MTVDIEAVTAILREVAAEEVMPRFRALAEHEVRTKNGGELVTVADVAAERQITRRLRGLLPGSQVVGEEATAEDPGLLEKFTRDDDWIWVIDPIDGTANFAAGRPVFALMVALVRRGETEAAWILDPIGPRCATAEMARQIQARRARVGAVKSLRCAGWEYLRLASGEIQFSLFTRLMPWDHVPGTLIYREAGGLAQTLDRVPYGARDHRAPGLLMAPDQASWDWLHDRLFGEDSPT